MTDAMTMQCLYCGGPLGSLGILNGLLWFRCLACGLSQACAVCPDCAGRPEVYDEETGALDQCATCDGSGLRLERTRAAVARSGEGSK